MHPLPRKGRPPVCCCPVHAPLTLALTVSMALRLALKVLQVLILASVWVREKASLLVPRPRVPFAEPRPPVVGATQPAPWQHPLRLGARPPFHGPFQWVLSPPLEAERRRR